MIDDRLSAVLVEPQLARFRELCDVPDEPLQVDFSGWHRHAILTRDKVFLFPRHRQWVRGLLLEKAVLQAIEGHRTPAARVLGSWQDDAISPYPFLCLTRLRGRSWGALCPPRDAPAALTDWLGLMDKLGRAIATWHRIDPATLPSSVRRRSTLSTEFAAELTHSAIDESTRRAAAAAELPTGLARHWAEQLRPLTRMRRVLVHGDIHETRYWSMRPAILPASSTGKRRVSAIRSRTSISANGDSRYSSSRITSRSYAGRCGSRTQPRAAANFPIGAPCICSFPYWSFPG